MSSALLIQLGLFIGAFVLVWLGAGLVITEVSQFAHSLKLSYFTLSFFLLGIMTSLPEFTVGVMATVHNDPQIFVGTLIGGVLILFLLIIPLLAVLGNGIDMPHQLDQKQILLSLFVVVAPSLLISDRKVTLLEGVLLIALYCLLILFVAKRENLVEKISDHMMTQGNKNFIRLLKIAGGVVLLVVASRQIVTSTEYFADLLHWSPFLVGLLAVSFGTNVPELSLVIRSVIEKKKNIALADYIGSAAANTLVFGISTLMYGSVITLPNHFIQRFIFLLTGLVLFFFFSRSKNSLSRAEGLVLVGFYFVFVAAEILVAGS